MSFELLLFFISKLVKSVLQLVDKLSNSLKPFTASLLRVSGSRSLVCLAPWSFQVRTGIDAPRVAVIQCSWFKYSPQLQQLSLPPSRPKQLLHPLLLSAGVALWGNSWEPVGLLRVLQVCSLTPAPLVYFFCPWR